MFFAPIPWFASEKEKTGHAARQHRISRGALLCNARINACSAQCLNSMHSFSAFLRGTLSLPLITPRYLARQNTPRKYRRFASASVGKHMKTVAWYEFCERARKSKIRATKQLAPPKSVALQGVPRLSFSDAITQISAKNSSNFLAQSAKIQETGG